MDKVQLRQDSKMQKPTAHAGPVTALVVTPEEDYAISISDDHIIKFWDICNGREVHELIWFGSLASSVTATSGGYSTILTSESFLLIVQDLEWSLESFKHPGEFYQITAIALTPEMVTSISGQKVPIRFQNIKKEQELYQGIRYGDLSTPLAIASNGSLVLSYGKSTYHGSHLQVWNLQSERELYSMEIEEDLGAVTSGTITPDGRYALVVSEGQTIRLLDMQVRRNLCILVESTAFVTATAVSSNTHLIVFATKDGTVTMWDRFKEEILASFTADAPVLSCAVTQDGMTIVAGDSSGRVHFLRRESC